MTRAAAVLVSLALPAFCGASGAFDHGRQPEFTAYPHPVAPVNVAWRASKPLTRGIELWASGRRDLATKWFEAAVHGLPSDPIAWHDLGVAYFCASRFEESYRCFQHERFLYMVSPSALYGMGMCRMAMGRSDLAEDLFAMALVEAPREWEYWHRFAQALSLSGKTDAALVAERNAARLKPRVRLVPRGVADVGRAVMRVRIPPVPHS